MQVRVRVMASMSRSGARDLTLPGDRAPLGQALRAFLSTYPPDRQVRDGDRLRRDVRVFVGDHLVRSAWGSDVLVEDGSEVLLVPAVSGG